MLKRMYVCRSSVLNIDWNIFLIYYLNYYLFMILYTIKYSNDGQGHRLSLTYNVHLRFCWVRVAQS